MRVKTPHAECPRVPAQRQSAQGESAPKARPKGVVDGKRANIPVLRGYCDGGTEKATPAGDWLSRFKAVGSASRQIRTRHPETRSRAPRREVVDAPLPGKASKLQVPPNRTPNRHRWARRESSGAGENSGEGTRQTSTVTSGEGAPAVRQRPRGGSGSGSQ
jgi:hypothetical protein